MDEKHDISDRLLMGYLLAGTPESFKTFVHGQPDLAAVLGPSDIDEIVGRVWSSSAIELARGLQARSLPGGGAADEFIVFGCLLTGGPRFDQEGLLRVGAALKALKGSDSVELLLLRDLEAALSLEAGDSQGALETLDAGIGRLFETRNHPRADCARHLLYRRKALVLARKGDFHGAHMAIETAEAIASRWRMFGTCHLSLRQHQAELLWMSGQPEEALLAHIDPDLRALAARARLVVWALRSHLDATKCAIDCKRTEIAEREIAAAREILASGRFEESHFMGFATLYAGQIDLQRGRIEESIEKYNTALALFQRLKPPFHAGVLEAKIALAEFALYEKNFRLFLEILKPLLAEAEQRGCVEARSRLLLLQAYLFVTDDPPVKEAWNRVVERVHLINNPALLLKALSFLYHYALVQLEEREQAFLLNRIRGLENSLEKSCFEGLYRSYVTERYEAAIETRLARVLEREDGRLAEGDAPRA